MSIERLQLINGVVVGVVCFGIGLRAILRGWIMVGRGAYRHRLEGTSALVYATVLTILGLAIFALSVAYAWELSVLLPILTPLVYASAVAFVLVQFGIWLFD